MINRFPALAFVTIALFACQPAERDENDLEADTDVPADELTDAPQYGTGREGDETLPVPGEPRMGGNDESGPEPIALEAMNAAERRAAIGDGAHCTFEASGMQGPILAVAPQNGGSSVAAVKRDARIVRIQTSFRDFDAVVAGPRINDPGLTLSVEREAGDGRLNRTNTYVWGANLIASRTGGDGEREYRGEWSCMTG